MEVKRKITAIMSIPRLAFTDNFWCVMRSFGGMGVPVWKHSGAFWEQSLSRLLYKAIDDGYDYVFTIDYDSVYEKADVLELVRLMEVSGADAIFPFQMKRECNNALVAVHPDELKDGAKPDFTKELTRARTGHFGLTILRCASLAKLPHPWFWAIPNQETQRWEDGKVDADIAFWQYTFADQWKVYQANRVVLGHIQRVITWADKNGQVHHQYMDDYEKDGKPRNLWGGRPTTEKVGDAAGIVSSEVGA